MLKSLNIKNIALIDELEVEFDSGLNVLSGETGAGKSIIIDSLSFVLGGKFDKTLIRQGEEKASVSALFLDDAGKASELLARYDIELGDEILLSRVVDRSGKGVAKINGVTVTASALKEIADLLIDIHGQNENQFILKSKNQMELVDLFGGEKLLSKRVEVESCYAKLQMANKQLKNLGGDASDQARALDFLKFQVEEIEKAKLKVGEDDELAELKRKMDNSSKISENLISAYGALGEQGAGVIKNLGTAVNALNSISGYGDEYSSLAERLKSARIEIEDILDEILTAKSGVEFNEYEYEKIDSRLDQIKALKRKYGATVEDVLKFLEETKCKIDDIENASEKISLIEKEKQGLEENLNILCLELTNLRKASSNKLEKFVLQELEEVGLKNAKFKIEISNVATSKLGANEIAFMFSANAGQQLMPLGKIISGGEMSRFCLALKNITASLDGISCMVFDEVDTGISGKMAEVIAEKMMKIAKVKQVISISHLPQVVAMADMSLFIEKIEVNGKTKTRIRALSYEEHVAEVARLIGSNMSGVHASLHAKDLIEFCKTYKSNL